jgi:hypothetical protein
MSSKTERVLQALWPQLEQIAILCDGSLAFAAACNVRQET